LTDYAQASKYWRDPFATALKERKPYRQYDGFADSAPTVRFDDAQLLKSEEYRAFLDVYLDMQAKHALEHKAGTYPDNYFSACRLHLALAFPDAHVRSHALCRIMRDHLATFGPAGCSSLMKTFSEHCIDGLQRTEIITLYDEALREHADHEILAYRVTSRGSLTAHVFVPKEDSNSAPRPAICFFFGGGWYIGMPDQFFNFCRYFAARGFVAVSFEYSTKGRWNASPLDAIQDTRCAIRWLRRHADQWRIDPACVNAVGWSAGGHLVASLPMITAREEPNADTAISARPDAVILLAACIDPTADNWFSYVLGGACDPGLLSPLHNIRSGLPPYLAFLGTRDEFIPMATTREFVQGMTAAGNRCELVVAEGLNHGSFMNDETCERIRAFL